MDIQSFEKSLNDLIEENGTSIFLASAKLFAKKIVYGKWFRPHEYLSAQAFERDFRRLFGRGKWIILDIQNLPADCVLKANLKSLYDISRLSSQYGPEPVRGFYFHFKRLPTIKEFETLFQGTFESEIEFVYRHLLKTGELKKLSTKEKQGSRWKKFLFRKQKEFIPYQFLSLSGIENEVLIFLREGLE